MTDFPFKVFPQCSSGRAMETITQVLRDELDLKGAKFDIVDAKTVDEVDAFTSTTDLILAAIEG